MTHGTSPGPGSDPAAVIHRPAGTPKPWPTAVLGFLLLSLATPPSYADGELDVETTPPPAIDVCGGAGTFSVTLSNESSETLENLRLRVDLPPGVTYVPGSVSGGSEVPAPPGMPVFELPALPFGESWEITYAAAADCSALAAGGRSLSVANDTRVDYDGGFDVEPAPPTYEILSAVLTLTTANVDPNPFEGDVRDVFERRITVTNSGLAAVDGFTLRDVHGSALEILDVAGGDWTSIDGIETIVVDAHLGPGDSAAITETIEVLACTPLVDGENLEGRSTLTVLWGCDEEVCNTGDPAASTRAEVVVLPGVPVLRAILPRSTDVCWDEHRQPIELKLENTGTGPARNVTLELGKLLPGYSDFVLGSFFLTGVDGASRDLTLLSAEPLSSLPRCVEDGIEEGLFEIPDVIRPGEEVILGWDAQICCPGVSVCNQRLDRNFWQWTVSYEDQCTAESRRTEVGVGNGSVALFSQSYEGPTDLFGRTPTFAGEVATIHFINRSVTLPPGDDTKTFEVSFTLGPGLEYVLDTLHLLSANGLVWLPDQYSLAIDGPNNGIEPTTITARFSAFPRPGNSTPFDWPSSAWLREFRQSEFRLDVRAICPAPPSTTIHQQVSFIPSLDCGELCALPLACDTRPINVKCPGCLRQGIHSLGFSIERESLGVTDNNNDGVADEEGVLDFDRVKRKRAVTGDVLVGKLSTVVMINENFNPYPFDHSLTFGYYSSMIENAGELTVLDAELVIHDFDPATGQYRDPFSVTISADEVGLPGNGFFYDFSIDTLGARLPASYTEFGDQDVVIFRPRYRVTGNIGRQGLLRSTVDNHIYLGADTLGPDVLPDFDPSPDCGAVLADGSIVECDERTQWYCTKAGGAFDLLGYAAGLSRDFPPPSSCRYLARFLPFFQVGDNLNQTNYFPFEYRNFGIFDNFTVETPAGFELVDSTLFYSRIGGTNLTAREDIEPFGPDGIVPGPPETLVFDLRQYFSADPDAAVPDDGSLYEGDESFVGDLRLFFAASCRTQAGVPLPFRATAALDLVDDVLPPEDPEDPVFTVLNSFVFRPPALSLLGSPSVVDGVERLACWEMIVGNQAPDADAGNVWLAATSPSGKMTVESVVDVASSSSLPRVDGLYRLGDVDRLDNRRVEICATYTCDFEEDALSIFSGWDCTGYPAGLEAYPCPGEIETAALEVKPKQATMQATVTAPGSAELCRPLSYEILVNSAAVGTMNDLEIRFAVPGGLAFHPTSGEMVYPLGSAPVPIADPVRVGNVYLWTLDCLHPALCGRGLPGGGLPGGGELSRLIIRFDLISDCDFSPGSAVGFEVSGVTNCGEGITLVSEEPLEILGFPEPASREVSIDVADFAGCAPATSARVEIVNSGDLPTGETELFRFVLPAGIRYVAGSFVGIENPPADPMPTETLAGSGTVLAWQLPPGVGAGESIVFAFELATTAATSCGPFVFSGIAVVSGTVGCGTAETCTLEAETGTAQDVAATVEPVLDGVPGDMVAECDAIPSAEVTAGDCEVAFAELRSDGRCPGDFTLARTWSVTDSCGNTTSASQLVTIRDTTPPALTPPSPLTSECNTAGGVAGSDPTILDWLALASAVDACGEATLTRDTPVFFPAGCDAASGTTTVAFTATDECGNSDSAASSVIVLDTTPPAVAMTPTLACLWPPNHRFVEVASYAVTDVCAPDASTASSLAVTSDEATATELGAGGPRHCPDAAVDALAADGVISLRAERAGKTGKNNGRVYGSVSIEATDRCGNVGLGSLPIGTAEDCPGAVCVPHDQNPKTPGQTPANDPTGPCPAIDDGQIYDATVCQ